MILFSSRRASALPFNDPSRCSMLWSLDADTIFISMINGELQELKLHLTSLGDNNQLCFTCYSDELVTRSDEDGDWMIGLVSRSVRM